MTRYRLPEIGGLEVEGAPNDLYAANYIRVEVPGVGGVLLPAAALTEATGPEPPEGTVYSDQAEAIVRCDDQADPQGRWWSTRRAEFMRWAHVADRIASHPELWRRYVPDPADPAAAAPPLLPWNRNVGEGRWLCVELSVRPGHVWIEADRGEVDADLLGEFAAAIQSARALAKAVPQ